MTPALWILLGVAIAYTPSFAVVGFLIGWHRVHEAIARHRERRHGVVR